jgi:hypothetical protein
MRKSRQPRYAAAISAAATLERAKLLQAGRNLICRIGCRRDGAVALNPYRRFPARTRAWLAGSLSPSNGQSEARAA